MSLSNGARSRSRLAVGSWLGAVITYAALASTVAACSSGSSSGSTSSSNAGDDAAVIGCGGDKRAESYASGMGQMGKGSAFRFVLMDAVPAPETTGTEVWTLKVTDAGGSPVTDATFPVMRPWMPLHGHGTATVTVTNNHDGTYTLDPMYLYMLGLWEIDMTAESGGKSDSTSFFFCLE
jgi:hypothetical protein